MKEMMRFFSLLLGILLSTATTGIFAQNTLKGYIIEIEGNNVYVDYTSDDVKAGDRLQVISEPKTIIHPVTKKEIVKEGEPIATLEISETQKDYSIAGRIYPANALTKLVVGMRVLPLDQAISKGLPTDGKVTVAIAEATVNDVVGIGYFGNYVADLLMVEMLTCDKIRLIDRSILRSQLDETDLSDAGYIKSDNAILKGQIAGVQYVIQVSMQRPDVTNITTGIPIKSILTAAGAVAGIAGASQGARDGLAIGSTVTSNVKKAKLKSAVSLTARVVDVQTGEVMFMCSGEGSAQGESQLAMEEGALGGLQINGGAEGFIQTVTGKAIAMAYQRVGKGLRSYFNGETAEKVINNGFIKSELTLRQGNFYMGEYRLLNKELIEIFEEHPDLYNEKSKGNFQRIFGTITMACAAGLTLTGCLVVATTPEVGSFNKSNDLIIIGGISAALATGGFFLRKSGKKKIKKVVNTYNSTLQKTSYNPEFNFGIAPGGLALQITF